MLRGEEVIVQHLEFEGSEASFQKLANTRDCFFPIQTKYLGSVASSVNQATGTMKFKNGLRIEKLQFEVGSSLQRVCTISKITNIIHHLITFLLPRL